VALTYEEGNALSQDMTFRGRIKMAGIAYAQSLSIQPNLSGAQTRWIQSTMMQPDAMAATLHPNVVLDPNVQASGSAVTDTELQASVQAVANRMM